MQYYLNSELATSYNVSKPTVAKWVSLALKGKLDLQMTHDGGKSFIAKTTKNRKIIEAMVKDGKKYFNSRSLKTIEPKPAFYALFSPDHILDIIANLDIRSEIPRQYNYFGDGAEEWDAHIVRRASELSPRSPVLIEAKQLVMNSSYLDAILERYKHVNVIDVGPGNALPAKELLAHLIKRGALGRYLAIDISPNMLEVAQRNIKEWFGNDVTFEADIRDITHERFAEQLAQAAFSDASSDTVNLVLLLGGTLGNLADPDEALRVIYHSMNRNDLLVYNLKLDSEQNRQIFDFASDNSELTPIHRLVLDLLNIESSFYDVEMGFDEQRRERYTLVRLKVALSITFNLPDGSREVHLKKDQGILVWRYRHQSANEVIAQFQANGFNVLQASQTEDHEFLLVICDLAGTGDRR